MKKMNKIALINTLKEKGNLSIEEATIAANAFENNFFISKKEEPKIIEELKLGLNCDDNLAKKIYDITIEIIKDEIKCKIKHPFRASK